VLPGLAITKLPVVALRPTAGLHVYDEPPCAVRPIVSPPQIAGEIPVIVMNTVGLGLTVIVTLSFPLHPPEVPVTVYVVVEPGLAVGLLQLVQLNPPGGLHKYVVAPLAVRLTLSPPQMVGADGVTVTVNDGAIVIVTV